MFTKEDVIFTYSRKQAIADGMLVDLSDQARDYGFKIPFACTEGVWGTVRWTDADEQRKPGAGQSTEGRLHDVLALSIHAARRTNDNRTTFRVLMVPKAGMAIEPEEVALHLTVGPGDDGKPVCTLMMIDED